MGIWRGKHLNFLSKSELGSFPSFGKSTWPYKFDFLMFFMTGGMTFYKTKYLKSKLKQIMKIVEISNGPQAAPMG